MDDTEAREQIIAHLREELGRLSVAQSVVSMCRCDVVLKVRSIDYEIQLTRAEARFALTEVQGRLEHRLSRHLKERDRVSG